MNDDRRVKPNPKVDAFLTKVLLVAGITLMLWGTFVALVWSQGLGLLLVGYGAFQVVHWHHRACRRRGGWAKR